MLGKLALRNIRRSVRDYAIYFVTLLIAITVFYAFNSVSDQQVMRDITESNRANIVDFTGYMMGVFSTVVALVLGFLVIYANSLLIRRRKREFGMYFTLGMKAGQVSRIILYETVLVGIVSLVLGLGLGILISQLLSFVTAWLFGIPMPNYQFEFSMNAFIMTLVCFLAIYVVVALFNVFSIRRCKLIDLINADARNQKVAIRNPWVCLFLFAASIAILAVAYWQLNENGMVLMFDDHFMIATVLMLVGTLLLFFSLSGFLIAIVTRLRGFYLRKLRPFTTRQVASKVNTSFASMWIVSVLLFFAITTFATGMGLCEAFTGKIQEANPYDATLISYQGYSDTETEEDGRAPFDIRNTEEYLREHVPDWDELVADSGRLDYYILPEMYFGDVMAATGATINSNASADYINVEVVGLSQFNKQLEMQGKQPVELGEDQYLVTNSMEVSEPVARAMAQEGYQLETPAGTLTPLPEVLNVQLGDFDILSNSATCVVPDRVLPELEAMDARSSAFFNVVYRSDKTEEVFMDRIVDSEIAGVTNVLTRAQMVGQAMGLRMVITYLALYIGLVLLVATAAVLAIQLLSLTIDSLSRYRMLSRLGCDTRMLGRSLFAQVVLYFIFPLVVAVCHSTWAIWVTSRSLFEVLATDLFPSIAMSAGFVLLIYGGYMLITYFASRATVTQGLKETA